jgi:hypothetical protein
MLFFASLFERMLIFISRVLGVCEILCSLTLSLRCECDSQVILKCNLCSFKKDIFAILKFSSPWLSRSPPLPLPLPPVTVCMGLRSENDFPWESGERVGGGDTGDGTE